MSIAIIGGAVPTQGALVSGATSATGGSSELNVISTSNMSVLLDLDILDPLTEAALLILTNNNDDDDSSVFSLLKALIAYQMAAVAIENAGGSAGNFLNGASSSNSALGTVVLA